MLVFPHRKVVGPSPEISATPPRTSLPVICSSAPTTCDLLVSGGIRVQSVEGYPSRGFYLHSYEEVIIYDWVRLLGGSTVWLAKFNFDVIVTSISPWCLIGGMDSVYISSGKAHASRT